VAGRIEHEADIQYQVDSSQGGSTPDKVVDLSPTGLRFLAWEQLAPGSVVKIDTLALSAVARVTRSEADDTTGFFSTGVRFLTLKLGRPRGTFVSARA